MASGMTGQPDPDILPSWIINQFVTEFKYSGSILLHRHKGKEGTSMNNRNVVEHFMAVSYFYLLMTEKSSAELTPSELEELIVAINDSNQRDNSPAAWM